MTNPRGSLLIPINGKARNGEALAPYLQRLEEDILFFKAQKGKPLLTRSNKIWSVGEGNKPIDQSMPSETTTLIPVPTGRAEPKNLLTSSSTSSLTNYQRLKYAGLIWRKYFAPLFLVIFISLPMAIFRGEYLSFLKYTSYVPLCGLIACSIPSSGVPVTGGIVFLPILTIIGIEKNNAVAFVVATQMFGVGIFTPLGWMYRDPGVIMLKRFLLPCLPIALLGLLTGLLALPSPNSEKELWAFIIFIIILAYYTGRGLIKNKLKGAESEIVPKTAPENASSESETESYDDLLLENQIEPEEGMPQEETGSTSSSREIEWTFTTFTIYAVCIFLGGVVTSWIGIGVEMISFLLLTAIHDVDVIAAGLSSVTLTGWLSLVAFGFRTTCAPVEDGPGLHWFCAPITEGEMNLDVHASGNIPYELCLAVLPGTMLGSLIGPKINAYLGPRNIMIIFVIFLIFNVVFIIMDLLV